MKLLLIAGARPNFIKIAPLMAAINRRRSQLSCHLVHTGQHYDEKMSDLFFRQLGIPEPDVNLGVGGGSHAAQTAAIMTAFEPVFLEHKPDAVLVVGDVNSTIACGLVAVKLGAKLIHVEAGLRSFDRTMPEEINRLLTDSISDLLFCSEQSGVDNLRKEGIPAERIHFVGNVMIDTLLQHRERALALPVLADFGLSRGGYAVVTLHRPSNVDTPAALRAVMEVLGHAQQRLPVIFPIHPRTRKNLASFGLENRLAEMRNVRVVEPLGYLEFLCLMASARLVLTDSGGIQEETTILDVPCITLRENTERPVTCELGTNHLAGTDPVRVMKVMDEVLSAPSGPSSDRRPPLWDGKAAHRITEVLASALC